MRRIRYHIFPVAAVCALIFTAFLLTGAVSLPPQLSDEAFWRMVTDFSEDGGYFRFENFLSNELAYQYVIPKLKQNVKPGGVYLGVGPEQNFTYIAALQPKMAFIIDIRRQNMIELLMYKALFELSVDRADFLSRLYSRKRPPLLGAGSTAEELFLGFNEQKTDRALAQRNAREIKDTLVKRHKFDLTKEDLDSIEYVYSVFVEAGPDLDYTIGGGGGGGSPTYRELMTAADREGQQRSYLATEENFRLVREMQRKNLIVPLAGDFAGPKAIRAVGQYLKDHDATATAFYLSNVEQYLFQQRNDWRQFYSNVAALPLDDSSTFIRSVNSGNFLRRSFGMRFQSVLSPIAELISAFNEGRVRSYTDVINMSQ